jgi:phage repressor protein C with HTH and peptisase S24 domain
MQKTKIQRLKEGESFITSERGNSMTPLIKSGQKHLLAPIELENVKVGDIVYCKVRGNLYTHLVTAINGKLGVQISNNHGHVNGWTKQVYGIVKEIY